MFIDQQVFGILLFGKNPRSKFKQAAFMASVEYGKNKVEPKTFDQPLVLIPDLIEEWLIKVLPLAKDTSSFKRKDIPNFPPKVLREAIINALVHRDYMIEGAKSSIEIDDLKIVIKSPGAPLPSISLEQLNTFKAPSISRNPMLTYVFSLMDYVEEKGFGMKALRSLYSEFNLPLPEYTFDDPFLSLSFPRNMDAIVEVSARTGIGELNADELKGFEWIKSQGEVSARDYTIQFGVTARTTSRHLSKMLELELIKTNGENPKSPKFRYSAT